jgi:hypothetical protein
MEKTTALQSEKKAYAKLSQRRDHRVVSVHPEFERNYFGRARFGSFGRFSESSNPRFPADESSETRRIWVREP